MAILTELPFESAAQLLDPYELTLVELSPLSAGSVNSNFFLVVRDQDDQERALFARIYEEQGQDGAEFELELNLALRDAHIPVASPVKRIDGGLVNDFGGKPFAVYERVAGEVSCQALVNEARAFAVGETLARVHCADLQGLQLQPSRFGFDQIRARAQTAAEAGRASLAPATERIFADCDRLECSRNLSLPQGLIHGDLFRDNVLLDGDDVSALLDFESASQGCFVYDLMVTALAWCFSDKLEPHLLGAMLRGYQGVRSLSIEEKAALVTEGSIACVRFAATRLTDFSLRVPDGQPPARDYARFFQRQDELERGVVERVLAQIS